MFAEIVFRMVVGGILVSTFALLSDALKPKRFAGLFGAAPSVTLATLALTATIKGKFYAAREAHSMIAGAVAFVLYAYCVFRLMLRLKHSAFNVTVSAISLWAAAVTTIWYVCLR
jgi:hypothetical protein